MSATLSRFPVILAFIAALGLSGCGYNDFQRLDEQTKSAWAEVLNQYQRRADLIPNLVETVKGEANFEQETLSRVIEARSRATAIQVTPEMLDDPQAMERFQQAQGQLGSALSRLLAVSENYPNLKANEAVRTLMEELTHTENKIGFSRQFYNDVVTQFNTKQQVFPTNMFASMLGFKPSDLWELPADSPERQTPKVNLSL